MKSTSREKWPVPLREGEWVAVVSPASAPNDADGLEAGLRVVRRWGLDVEYRPLAPEGFLAGKDPARRQWVQAAFDDPQYAAVLCTRGGYGTQRIIDNLRVDEIVSRQAAFVGFSDITPLHTILNREGLVTFYGPPLSKLATSPRSAASLRAALFATDEIVLRSDGESTAGDSTVEGRVLGGNLTMLASSVGTASALIADGAIVFFEEDREQPREIDRSLTQLIRSGAFDGVRGFVLGQFTDCENPLDKQTVHDVLRERLNRFEVPVVSGFVVGHGNEQETLPLGATATLLPSLGELRYVRPTE